MITETTMLKIPKHGEHILKAVIDIKMTTIPKHGQHVLKLLCKHNAVCEASAVASHTLRLGMHQIPHKERTWSGDMYAPLFSHLLKRLEKGGFLTRCVPKDRPIRFGYDQYLTPYGLETALRLNKERTKCSRLT
jgi:hypothetical protein